MKIRLSTIAALGAAAVAGLLLFQTSQNVQQAETRLRETRAALTKEEASVRVLETEWDYLNRPDRLEELTRQHLKIRTPKPNALVRDSGTAIRPPAAMKPVQAVEKPVPAAPKITAPMPAPVSNDAHTQFDELLGTLTEGGAQ